MQFVYLELSDETVHALEDDNTSYIIRFIKDAIAHSKHVLHGILSSSCY